jgi:hypothetical protein
MERQLVVVELHVDLNPLGQGATDIDQLAGRHGDAATLGHLGRRTGDHLDLHVGTGDAQSLVYGLDQEVGQYRQRLPTLHHIDHLRNRCQQGLTRNRELHGCSFKADRVQALLLLVVYKKERSVATGPVKTVENMIFLMFQYLANQNPVYETTAFLCASVDNRAIIIHSLPTRCAPA